MRTLYSFLFVTIVFIVKAQPGEPYNYIVKKPVIVYPYNFNSSTSYPLTPLTANPEIKFSIANAYNDPTLGDVYIIQFDPITFSPSVYNNPSNINSSNTGAMQYYCIKVSEFDDVKIKKRYYTGLYNYKLSLGTLMLPVKMRPRKAGIPLDFKDDFTLGPTLGMSFRVSRYNPSYVSLIITGGIVNIGVDSITTRGNVLEPTKLGGYSYGFGAIFESGVFQAAFIIGWDIIGGTKGSYWIYNNRNWFSIGLGVQLWKPST